MKYNIKTAKWLKAGFLMLTIASVFYACQPDAVNIGLGTLPKADFNATVNTDGFSVLLANKSSVASMPYWSVADLNLGFKDLKGDSLKVKFTFPGTHNIKMLVAGAGGLDSIAKTVTTTLPDPNACDPSTPLGFIASCTQKTWKLNPAPGAFKVAPTEGSGSWWTSGTQEVIDRPCAFNDTYTFTFNKAGDFAYDDKGDFFSDDYLNASNNTCLNSSQYNAAQKPWGSGNFNYVIIPGTGVKGLGQLKLIGLGAHIGIQKAVNGSETKTGATATSVTYDIWSMEHVTDASGTYDLLTLTLHYATGDGWWTFTLRSY